jgi:hypothetical protein
MGEARGYLALLGKWQRPSISSVGPPSTIPGVATFSTAPSSFAFCPRVGFASPISAAAPGFPGSSSRSWGLPEVHLVEADRRKAQFLREAARQLASANVTVHAVRIEALT